MMILSFTLFMWDDDQASRHSGLKMTKNTTGNIVFPGFGWRDKRSGTGVAGKHFETPIDVVLVFRPDLAACIGPQFENDELMGYKPLIIDIHCDLLARRDGEYIWIVMIIRYGEIYRGGWATGNKKDSKVQPKQYENLFHRDFPKAEGRTIEFYPFS